MPLAGRLASALGVAAIGVAGCAHAPAPGAGARREQPYRVLVTGSRIPRPVGRDGLPVTDYPLRIYRRGDLVRSGEPDLARALRKLDVDSM
jgi:hypothetical protein